MTDLSLPPASRNTAGQPLQLALAIEEPECVAALAALPAGGPRERFALTALRIGILALSQAQGRLDAEAIRGEGERLVAALEARLSEHAQRTENHIGQTLRSYFDPQDGRFAERVERLVRQDGELERLMRAQVQSTQSQLAETLARHVGDASPIMALLAPEDGNRFIAALRGTVDGALAATSGQVLREFSLDNPQGALARLVRELTERHGALAQGLENRIDGAVGEFSLDNPDSALSRLVGRVEAAQRRIGEEFSLDAEGSALARMRRELMQVLETHQTGARDFQQQVLAALEAMKARRSEAARSTTHGHDFEQAGFALLAQFAAGAGDRAEAVGDTVGTMPRCKVGDALVILSEDCAAAGARIAVEFKEAGGYTLSATLTEIDEAMRNREAGIGLFVHSKRSAPEGLDPLARHGNRIVVVWDSEDATSDAYFRAGLLAAKALAVRARREAAARATDLAAIERAIGHIERQAGALEEVLTWAGTIQSNGEKIAKRVKTVRESLAEETEVLAAQLAELRRES